MRNIKKTLSLKSTPKPKESAELAVTSEYSEANEITETSNQPANTAMDTCIGTGITNTAAEPISQIPEKHYVRPTGTHRVIAEATVGLQHRNIKPHALPCQDAASATVKPRPILVLCDGAGSASMSDVGSSALTVHISRLCQSIEPILADYLDCAESATEPSSLVRIIIRHAMGVLEDLSTTHRRDIRDFRSTLNFALIGTEHTLWIRVGDGEIVQEKIGYFSDNPTKLKSEINCVGEHAKGEYANQTVFIDNHLTLNDVQWGLLNTPEITGLALMSDGATEKLVAHNRGAVSGQVGVWLEQLRQDTLKASDICKRFYSEAFNHQSTGDDRSIALWARAFD